MAQYIDKDALVEKIKDLKLNINWIYEEFSGAKEIAYDNVLDAINRLEVKEVDLEEELEDWLGERVGKWTGKECERMCRYFFELGLKAQKGGKL